MKRFTFLTLAAIIIPAVSAFSQSVIRESVGSVATSFSSDRFDLQACVGQPYVAVGTGNSHRPGFIQPQTEVRSFSTDYKLELFPNPVSNILNYRISEDVSDITITVMDMIGNIIYRQNNPMSTGGIDCSLWIGGMYIIQIQKANQVIGVGKIIKT